jgi:cyanobactin maturation PatA/PatG family protease
VSTDPVEENAAFADKYDLPFPLLSDTTGEVCLAYGACDSAGDRAKRVTFLIGPDGTIWQVYEDVDPVNHAESLLAAIDERLEQAQEVNSALSVSWSPRARSRELVTEEKESRMEEEITDVEIQPQGVEGDAPEGVTEQVSMPEMEDAEQGSRDMATGRGLVGGVRSSRMRAPTGLRRRPAIAPSQVQSPAQPDQAATLVYALGEIGYDYGTEARQDAIVDAMGLDENGHRRNAYDPRNLLAYLNEHPYEAPAVIWTLNVDATAIYAVQPAGPYANVGFERLREFLQAQLDKEVERVSIPGIVLGEVRLMNGQVLPVILPEPRGMFSWTTQALIQSVMEQMSVEESARENTEAGLRNFLDRIYYEIRNLGLSPQERALNFAATNAFQIEQVFLGAATARRVLDEISVERSPICRPDSDCWDVLMSFFDPENVLRSRRISRFTIDVSDVVPVMVGDIRSWEAR